MSTDLYRHKASGRIYRARIPLKSGSIKMVPGEFVTYYAMDNPMEEEYIRLQRNFAESFEKLREDEVVQRITPDLSTSISLSESTLLQMRTSNLVRWALYLQEQIKIMLKSPPTGRGKNKSTPILTSPKKVKESKNATSKEKPHPRSSKGILGGGEIPSDL